jgi:Na+-transporting NADH:ubiquinone oxidoreductase subunit NqrE
MKTKLVFLVTNYMTAVLQVTVQQYRHALYNSVGIFEHALQLPFLCNKAVEFKREVQSAGGTLWGLGS